MENLKRIVSEQRFFKDLSEPHLDLVVGCCKNLVIKPGQFLFKEGEKADQFYVIREGQVALECHVPRREPVVIESLRENDVLGWSWMIPPYRWHFDAHTVTSVRLLAFDGACLRKKMEADSELGYKLMKMFMPVVLDRLQATRLRVLDVYSNPNVRGLEN